MTAHLEADHAAEALHLLHGNVVVGVRLQAGVVHARNLGVRLQPLQSTTRTNSLHSRSTHCSCPMPAAPQLPLPFLGGTYYTQPLLPACKQLP